MKNLTLETKPLHEWGISNGSPLIISGPCSAETREQVLQTARSIVEVAPEVKLFRAGIWKPRTRPNAFEGHGIAALPWLKEVKEETGLLTTIEVGNAKHVYEALKHNIDVLWIGARTTANPFSVHEIAKALRGVDIPVFVKNPVNPDLQLWVGALERVHGAGITRLGAIHRGFSSGQNRDYRNPPMWKIPIELKRLLPNIPVLCDPSHICGNRTLLAKTAQRALDLAMDGLMIESHPVPEEAWSDSAQQITPQSLSEMLKNLRWRNRVNSGAQTADLSAYREEIDVIDTDLLEALARRFKVVEDIARYKKERNMTVLQVSRWDELLRNRMRRAEDMGIDKEFIEELYKQIHLLSIRSQTRIMNSEE